MSTTARVPPTGRDRVLWLLLPLGVGVAGLLILLVLGAAGGVRVMPSYLAAWLFWLSVPVGALAVVMVLELAGYSETATAAAMRPLLVLLPLGAVFMLPVLVRLPALYGWVHAPLPGFAGGWYTTGFFVARSLVYLLAWSLLALAFLRPHRFRDRRGLAGFGLVVHFSIGSLAALDWAMSITPGLNSSVYGLVVIVGQCSLAVATGLVLTAGGLNAPTLRKAAWLMVAVLAASAFLHFVQYLTIWSADLPREIAWYQARRGAGVMVPWFGVIVLVLSSSLMLPTRLSAVGGLVAGLAALVVLVQALAVYWTITPSFSGVWHLGLADLLALLGIGGVMVALFGVTSGRARGEPPLIPARFALVGAGHGRS